MTQEKKIYVIGIDFGTTNTTICYFDPQFNQVNVILDSSGNGQNASLLLFEKGKDGNLTQFGNALKNNPSLQSLVREIKRFIGKDYDDMVQMAEDLGMMIEKGKEGECIFVVEDSTTGEELKFTAEELISIQLRHIKKIITSQCKNADFSRVVMTVPSSFNEKQKQCMKYAYEIAGITPITVMNEPTSAFNEYKNFDKQRKINKVLVIDIGGGTTDVCVCEVDVSGMMRVKGNSGDPLLGGSDFDQLLMNIIIEQLETNGYEKMHLFKQGDRENKKQKKERMKYLNKLKKEAEQAKIALTREKNYELHSESILPRGDEFDDIVISREEFEEKIKEEGLLGGIEDCIDNCLEKADTNIDEIDTVLLVGGVPKTPIVKKLIQDKFGLQKILNNDNYDSMTAVAKGAARYAYDYSLKTSKVEKLIEQFPQSIGLEVFGGKIEKIAKKGEVPPINWEKTFTTTSSNQDKLSFELYKGEKTYAGDNEYICEISVTNLPRMAAGQVQVTFHVDIEKNGNMNLRAVQRGTNQQPKTMSVNCGFDQTDEKKKESMEKIEPFCPPK